MQNLYGALDEVKEGKADKETVQIEVEEVCVHVCSIRINQSSATVLAYTDKQTDSCLVNGTLSYVVCLSMQKADRTALESKASRHWVESTFEKLDREIREAKSQLAAQDEQFRGNMERITHDVETKLDRDEMETLRDYIGRA